MTVLVSLLLILVSFLAGSLFTEEHVKRITTKFDLGTPYFFASFWFIGIKEHEAFGWCRHFCLTVPGLQVIEHWDRLIGPIWIRVGVDQMSREDMMNYFDGIHQMMETRYAQMGIRKGKDATIAGVPTESSDTSKPPQG